MPRTTDDVPITTRAARDRLAVRNKPYWRAIDTGAAIGYRKGATGGQWLVRIANPAQQGAYRQAALGRADDALKAAGDTVLDWRAAEAKARDWIARQHRIAAGLEPEPDAAPAAPYTVADAMADYIADYVARGGKALGNMRTSTNAYILPAMGKVPVGRLTRELVRNWHRAIAASPARVRSKPGQQRHRDASADPDALRRRHSTANRVLTVLKAALNHARSEGKATCPADAWAAVKAFREADKARVRYLLEPEITRLWNACPPDFRELVTAALLTGCRYGELAAMVVSDFDPQAGTVTIGRSKSGKPRHVALTDEGQRFFAQMAAGKPGTDRLFQRERIAKQASRTRPAQMARVPWAKSDQSRLMHNACAAAGITPAASFHELRHTYGSRLAGKGVPLVVIAAQLGHADTRMTERHYAHLAPSYIADTVRQSFGTLGIVPDCTIATLVPRKAVG